MTTSASSLIPSLIESAILAPSSHNAQPWLFQIDGDAIVLIADRTRALPVNDPLDRELTISCGCALFNLRVAAAAAGWRARVATNLVEPDALARVEFEHVGKPLALGELHSGIATRRTYRKRFTESAIDSATTGSLRDAVRTEGAHLVTIDDPRERIDVAALVAEGDALQWDNAHWRRELASWMHPRRRGDGLTLPTLAMPMAQWVVRTFDMGNGQGAKDRELADASPLLTVFCTTGDSVQDWLSVGQALQHALLKGLTHGLQASYLNQPVQVAALRPRLQALCGEAGVPQLLVRWGLPSASLPAAPRRPVGDVVLRT